GEPDGLFGINCGHRMRGVSDGLFIYREKQYDEEENSEEYEKVCKQRQMERNIRKDRRTRDALEAAGDTEGAKELRRKIAEENKQLKEYCDREGLNYRQGRTQHYGYYGNREKISVPRPSEENSQFYKPIITSKGDVIDLKRTRNSETIEITARRLIGRNNAIYLSDKATIKPKALHELDSRATEVYKILGVTDNENLPKICIISDKEMLSHAPAAYNAIDNILYFNDKYDKIELSETFKVQMACSGNPLSTMLHETLHWKDAQDYIKKFGKIESLADLNKYENDLFKKKLDELTEKGYNIYDISAYATNMLYSLNKKYYEAYTEYRVLQILSG
ncbi:MAG: phage minor capsid protein, partial [Ruminiclostridium sp.]